MCICHLCWYYYHAFIQSKSVWMTKPKEMVSLLSLEQYPSSSGNSLIKKQQEQKAGNRWRPQSSSQFIHISNTGPNKTLSIFLSPCNTPSHPLTYMHLYPAHALPLPPPHQPLSKLGHASQLAAHTFLSFSSFWILMLLWSNLVQFSLQGTQDYCAYWAEASRRGSLRCWEARGGWWRGRGWSVETRGIVKWRMKRQMEDGTIGMGKKW